MKGPKGPKAVIAMSGGVDSSVAAALLVEEGYDVTGIMLKLWRGDEINNASGCCSVGAADDARRVADVLGIPFYVFNFAARFEETVVADFNSTYLSGRTPNPCVRCNQWIKFDALFAKARGLGADVLATGHYARIRNRAGRRVLLRGNDPHKDQSYVLWMLTQDHLAHTSFPVGEMPKTETRALAESLGLRTARKPDSQEICFVRDGDFDAYVDEHLAPAAEAGPIVDGGGHRVGTHRGIGRYTVGQRKGLGVAVGVPVFVTSIESASNTLVIGRREDLAAGGIVAEETSFTDRSVRPRERVLVQHRAHGEVRPATVARVEGAMFEIDYDDPVEAVAPGQSAVLYSAAEPAVLLGGGVIEHVSPAVPNRTRVPEHAR